MNLCHHRLQIPNQAHQLCQFMASRWSPYDPGPLPPQQFTPRQLLFTMNYYLGPGNTCPTADCCPAYSTPPINSNPIPNSFHFVLSWYSLATYLTLPSLANSFHHSYLNLPFFIDLIVALPLFKCWYKWLLI